MKRVLQIVGGKKEKVIESACECPLRNIDEDYCGHPDSECLYCTLGDRVGDVCPLPEFWHDDDNNRTGKNGEHIISVEECFQQCGGDEGCFYLDESGRFCRCEDDGVHCDASLRNDGKNVYWKIKKEK